MYIKGVIVPTHLTTLLSIVLPLIVINTIDPSIGRLVLTTLTSIINSCLSIYTIGIDEGERLFVNSKVKLAINKIIK